jgi:4'-phosphopantetheinyl transferase
MTLQAAICWRPIAHAGPRICPAEAWSDVPLERCVEWPVNGACLPSSDVRVWLEDLDADDAGHFDPALLSFEERQAVDRLKDDGQRLRMQRTRALVRVRLAALLDADPRQLEFARGPNGKPELAGEHRGRLQFNLSHSGRYGLLGISATNEVGLDIEEVRNVPSLTDTARHFFRPKEWEALRQLSADQFVAAFCRLWTLKEAAAKAVGQNLAWGMTHVSVAIDSAGAISTVRSPLAGLHAWMG